MKHKIMYSLILGFLLIGCSDESSNEAKFMDEEDLGGTTSWAFEFVYYNGNSYELTDIKIEQSDVGEQIGEVRRDITDQDTSKNFHEGNFDSVVLSKGTPLYENKKNKDSIIFKVGNQYFMAKIRDWRSKRLRILSFNIIGNGSGNISWRKDGRREKFLMVSHSLFSF